MGVERWPNFAILFLQFGVLAMFRLNPQSASGAWHHAAFMGNWPIFINHVFTLIHPLDEFSFKEMRTWSQSKISSCCLCVQCKSRGIRRGGGQCNIHQWWRASPQTFQLQKIIGRVAFRILSNINDGVPLGKYVELGDWANGGYVDGLLHV